MEGIKIILNENIKFIIVVGIAYCLDFITGFSKAVFLHDVQSSKLKKSVVKGIMYFSFIIIGGCLEILFPVAPDKTMWKLQTICLGISLTDFWSVVENARGYADVPFIAKILEQFKKQTENELQLNLDEVIDDDNGQVD